MKVTAKDYKLYTKKQSILFETLNDKVRAGPVWLWKDHGDLQNSFGLVARRQALIYWSGPTSQVSLYTSLGLHWFITELGWKEVPEDELFKLIISSGVTMSDFHQFKDRHTFIQIRVSLQWLINLLGVS